MKDKNIFMYFGWAASWISMASAIVALGYFIKKAYDKSTIAAKNNLRYETAIKTYEGIVNAKIIDSMYFKNEAFGRIPTVAFSAIDLNDSSKTYYINLLCPSNRKTTFNENTKNLNNTSIEQIVVSLMPGNIVRFPVREKYQIDGKVYVREYFNNELYGSLHKEFVKVLGYQAVK